MVRLAHFSDIHVTSEPLGWETRDWFNKRLPGWINLRWLGRGRRFRTADDVVEALVADLRQRRPDHLVFSGDATAMGFETEFMHAAELLRLKDPDLPPGIAVPGNHDYYTRASAKVGHFERYFTPWQTGERIDDFTYPFAQRVGSVWLVAVNSCTGNRWTWDASGQVDAPQLERLDQLLAHLEPAPRILVTHYPICLASGKRERRTHGLRNLTDLIAVAARGGVGLWLHGHRHGAYYLSHPGVAPFPVVCVGSATQSGYWSYNEYAVEGRQVRATRRRYDPERRRFADSESFELQMP
jgi:3',5'-cyclic AMP phosphodiesterase CpdA